MRRRHAEVQRALKAHAEEEGEVAASGPSYSSDEEGDYGEGNKGAWGVSGMAGVSLPA